MNYFDFFVQATGCEAGPWPFQERFHADPATHTALIVPTGMGKTWTVLTDWLHRRPTTRLVWVLPGRALTVQVAAEARRLVGKAGVAVKVVELMGQSDDLDLTLSPDEPAILVGTLDILVSRALNRGYARSPFRWPIDFGLLNNDIQWVFDEVQLLGEALATGAQLAAFRECYGTFGQTPSVWTSATFNPDWLNTVDFQGPVRRVTLESDDRQRPPMSDRLHASKTLAQAPDYCRLPTGVADFVRKEHREGHLTLVIANTVQRAREIAEELRLLNPVLLHSRFRPEDKRRQFDKLMSNSGGIAVSTQVIEAGLDIDADLMITDIAPWPSLVQRFGRVNRKGERTASRIFWVDRPLTAKRKTWASTPDLKPKDAEDVFRPYETKEIDRASEILATLTSAAPADLTGIDTEAPYSFVLRRADLLDLFDTTPDLTGNQIDISRFVRSAEDTDVYVAWRDWQKDTPPRSPRVSAGEMCAVLLSQAIDFVGKQDEAWTWRYARKGAWEKIRKDDIFPGMRILLRTSAGGYLPDQGWVPESKVRVPPITPRSEQAEEPEEQEPTASEEAGDDDQLSRGGWRTLAQHTGGVFEEMNRICESLAAKGAAAFLDVLTLAARRHDWGKAHSVFQTTMHDAEHGAEQLWAKSPHKGKHKQPFFRHELASALAMLQNGDPDLAAYLVAAHHGKVRMNIRSMPGEKPDDDRRLARGIKDRDRLPLANLGGGCVMPETTLSLQPSELGFDDDGAGSWSAMANRLLERYGPFRLAYLEMLLRAADEKTSATERTGA